MRSRSLGGAAAVALLAGCSSAQCVSGASIACNCRGGAAATQVCQADGTYGPCGCAHATASGSSGVHGSSGSSSGTTSANGSTSGGTGGVQSQLGKPCASNADCLSGYCTPVGGPVDAGRTGSVCSEPCTLTFPCTRGWTCGAVAGLSGSFCLCTYSPQVCDGQDDNCTGTVDNEPAADQACGGGNACVDGQCQPGFSPTFANIDSQIFQRGCALSGCHDGAGTSASNLDLLHSPYAALLGDGGTGASASSVGSPYYYDYSGLLLVKPGDPAHSLLYLKLTGGSPGCPQTDAGSCQFGELMPPNLLQALSAPYVAAVGQWITDGAPND